MPFSLRALASVALTLLVLFPLQAAPSTGEPTIEVGHLEVTWGDSGKHGTHAKVTVDFVDRRGQRRRLDVKQAERAAGDLHALAGKRVGISLSAPTKSQRQSSRELVWSVDAIVPAEISAQPHTVSKQAMAAAPKVAGSTPWITLACRFADVTAEQKDLAFFESQYGDLPSQLGHYWNEVSYGAVNLAGSRALGWYALPMPREAYVNPGGSMNLTKLSTDCIAQADGEVDFTGVTGINLMFNAELDGYAWGGQRCMTLDGTYRCWPTTWNPPWSFNNLAPLAHEMGHGYGLPHSNNSDMDLDPYDNPWDNMSDAWRNGTPNALYGTLPKHINAFQRDRLGWLDGSRKMVFEPDMTEGVTVELAAANLSGTPAEHPQMIVLRMPLETDPYKTVLYTVEARFKTGTYDSRLAGDAVIIHRIEQSVAFSVDADNPAADISNNEGSMFKVGEAWATANQEHWVIVTEKTATGFVLRLGQRPRVTGGGLPPRAL